MSQGRSRWSKFALNATALLAATALTAAACSSSTSDKDKTATAAAKGGSTPAATVGATKAAATVAATKAATTPAAGATTAATAAAPAAGAATGVKVADSALGKILVDSAGFTLYTFKNDVAGNGKSAGEALTAVWPPLALSAAPSGVAGATGAWAVITRADGKTQVTYKGLPLYYFVNDKAAGDTKGDKVQGVWFVAVP